MAAILNSTVDSWITKLHPFILTQLDDGSHLEIYHIGFRHCYRGFRHLLIFSQIHSKTLSLHPDYWLKLIQSDSNSFILTQLDDGSHLEFGHLGFSHLGFSYLSVSSQTHSHFARIGSHHLHKRDLHSFILPQLDDGSHLEFYCCWIKKYFYSFILTQLDDGSHLEFYHCRIKKTSLIHTDSTWWWQPSWIPAMLDSDTLFSSLRFTQKHCSLHSGLWLKLI